MLELLNLEIALETWSTSSPVCLYSTLHILVSYLGWRMDCIPKGQVCEETMWMSTMTNVNLLGPPISDDLRNLNLLCGRPHIVFHRMETNLLQWKRNRRVFTKQPCCQMRRILFFSQRDLCCSVFFQIWSVTAMPRSETTRQNALLVKMKQDRFGRLYFLCGPVWSASLVVDPVAEFKRFT